jgi:predicted transcriptional regulator
LEEGFIVSNKIRRAVFREIQTGEKDINQITKKCHLVRRAVEKATDELIEQGLIKKRRNKLALTEKGEKISFTEEKTKGL